MRVHLPPLPEAQYEALKADIAERGVMVPVEVDADTGEVLDGANRQRICAELGVDAPVVMRSFESDAERVAHALKMNLLRRQLSDEAWSDAFEQLAEARGVRLGKGGDRKSTATVAVDSAATLAAELGVTDRTARHRRKNAQRVKGLREQGRGDLADQVNEGAVSLRNAEREAGVQRSRPRPAPEVPVGEFSVVLGDPPWRYESATTEPGRAIENHYPTMTLDEIVELGSRLPFAKDAVLFLWATSPKLAEALRVMDGWGFEYRTNAVWVKNQIGMGYWFRQRHELLLVGRRGSMPVPEPAARVDSVIEAPRGRHSEKPESVYGVIEGMYPDAPRLELFARGSREGWTCWGNEAGG